VFSTTKNKKKKQFKDGDKKKTHKFMNKIKKEIKKTKKRNISWKKNTNYTLKQLVWNEIYIFNNN